MGGGEGGGGGGGGEQFIMYMFKTLEILKKYFFISLNKYISSYSENYNIYADTVTQL